MKEEVIIKVEGKEWKDLLDKAFKEVVKDVKADGFRKGMVPRNIYEKKYGKQELIYNAADKAIQSKYSEVVLEGKINPIIEPKINIVKMDDEVFEAKMILITEPSVKLGEYKGLKVKKETAKVSKKEIDNEINKLLEEYAELNIKDGKVENGDIAIIDYEGFKDGTPFEGGKATNYSLTIGSNTFIPGFEDGIIGMERGEEKELKLTFPKDYASEELKGQKVVFKVKVNEIKTRVIPELNDEFFSDLGMDNIKTKEDLEKTIKEELLAQKNHELEHKFEDDLLETISKNMEIDLASELIDDEKEYMYKDLLEHMKMQGITEDIYLKYTNTTKDKILENMTEEATKRLKYRYLLKEIIRLENIDVSDEELNNKIDTLAKQYNMTNEEVKKEIGNIEYLRYDMKYQKAVDLLKSSN